MRLTAIAAMAKNRVIGTGQGIPWDIPGDRAHFRAYTAGKALLLGRKTFAEMHGWFSDHRPVILTSNPSFAHPDAAAVVSTIDEALETATAWGEPELVVCGGAATYHAALPRLTDAVITEIDAVFVGEARFPPLPTSDWRILSQVAHPPESAGTPAYSIVHYTRR